MTDAAGFEAMDWAPFIRGTAGRPTMPFLAQTLELVDADPLESLAVDLGCGAGIETIALASLGWSVHAIDGSPAAEEELRKALPGGLEDRVHVEIEGFDAVDIPVADLIYASFSLPFAGDSLDDLMTRVTAALGEGSVFGGHFFGINDDWADDDGVRAVDRGWIDSTFADFDEVFVDEIDADGPYGVKGETKHWHFYFVRARR